MLIDTHAHPHFLDYPDPGGAIKRAQESGVEKILCIGTSAEDSAVAVEFAQEYKQCVATIGLHPH